MGWDQMPGERGCAMAKILVINDNLGVLDLLTTILRRKGHKVVLAELGRNGLKLFQQERPHVTILDLKLPDMDGLAVLREIRTLDPKAPVFILTGFGTEEKERYACELGVTEFLQKDSALHTLHTLHTLGAALGRVLT